MVNCDCLYFRRRVFSKKIDFDKNCLTPLNKAFPDIPIATDQVLETHGVAKTVFREIDFLNFDTQNMSSL